MRFSQLLRRPRLLFAVGCVLLLVSILDYISAAGKLPSWAWRSILVDPERVVADEGYSFIVQTHLERFSSHKGPSVARLFEDGKELTLGNYLHSGIRELGGGRFSFWYDTLYFSSSDGSNPMENGKQYVILVPWALPEKGAFLLYATTLLWWMWLAVLTIRRPQSSRTLGFIAPALHWLYVNVLPGVVVTAVLLILLSIGGELYFRREMPFISTVWPTHFDDRYGFNFEPNAEVRWTNLADYWVSERTNSLGFLDREPPVKEKGEDVCRVVFIGDSFVEAAQVPLRDKFHIVFESMANQSLRTGFRYETIAFGYSGAGQINELPFYDVFAKSFEPDVLVLVFVVNDFANNSPELESVRNGWHPYHPPRLFYAFDRERNSYTVIPIDPMWMDYLLPKSIFVPTPQNRVGQWLQNKSYLYAWLSSRYNFMFRASKMAEIYRNRMVSLEKQGLVSADVFGTWDPRLKNMDIMFDENALPPVFQDAIALTGKAFDEFQARSDRDRFSLVVLSVADVHARYPVMFSRLASLLSERHIPLVDQYEYLQRKGHDPDAAHFRYDGHWNEDGHRWAAEALLEYFKEHPGVCGKN